MTDASISKNLFIPSFKKVILAEKSYSHLKCPNCENSDGIKITIKYSRASVFWIPFFSTWKRTEVLCFRCKKELIKEDRTRQIRMEIANLKSKKHIPIWTFIGLIIIILNIGITEIIANRRDAKYLEMLSQPKVGDVYGYYLKSEKMATYKVIETFEDSLYISPSKYQTNDELEMKGMVEESYYANYYFPMTKAELMELYHNETLFWIKSR